MTEEPRLIRASAGRFQSRSHVLSADDVARATRRMAHEIIEHNHGLDDVVLIGLERGGVPIAEALGTALTTIDGVTVPTGSVDVSFYRDDIGTTSVLPEVTKIDFPVTDRHARDIITFPVDQHLTRAQQDHVIETVRDFYAGR